MRSPSFALVAFVALMCVAAVAASPVIPKQYPLFKQCDSRWGKNLIVSETICQVGCLMSSISMSLRGHGFAVPLNGTHVDANPGTVNEFLREHHGYDNSNDLFEGVIQQINPHDIVYDGKIDSLNMAQVQENLKNGSSVIIANVMHGRHFVLVTGWDSNSATTLMVNDPGFQRSTYDLKADVVGWRKFTMHG